MIQVHPNIVHFVSCTLLYVTLTMDVGGGGGGADHDKIILLSTPFTIIPILVTNCRCNFMFVLFWN